MALLLCISATPATAELFDEQGWEAISDDQLDAQRGGFTTENGMSISLGIEKSVAIDGVLQYVTTLSIPDLTKMDESAGLAWKTFIPAGNLTLDQSAGGLTSIINDADTLIMNHGLDTIIQSSMDGRIIQVNTIINAHIDSLSLYREIGLMDLVTSQLIDAMKQ